MESELPRNAQTAVTEYESSRMSNEASIHVMKHVGGWEGGAE